ncbi:hypothetical protein WG902_13815 [Ramlibacter sp. PS3R-8]|uniref:hypothetical protein n=1 Tax=Ramlibacter sp. PS3R-8 TaxID=3133437 RepID=UPI0030985BBD
MKLVSSPRFLPTVLWIDAVSAAGSGLLQVGAASLLAGWLGVPAALLSASGVALFAFAALAAWSAHARPIPRAAVYVLVAANAAWVLGCVELLLTGSTLTMLGQAFLVVQALFVGVVAELEWMGLRRAPAAAWA